MVSATGNIKNITLLCRTSNVPVEELVPKTLQGWQGKPKGMLQVLWERGFIDVTNINQYTVGGRKDEMGVLQTETSLKFLLGNCLDFEEEELFPLISGVSEEIDQLIYMLQDDHTEIENLFQKIQH